MDIEQNPEMLTCPVCGSLIWTEKLAAEDGFCMVCGVRLWLVKMNRTRKCEIEADFLGVPTPYKSPMQFLSGWLNAQQQGKLVAEARLLEDENRGKVAWGK